MWTLLKTADPADYFGIEMKTVVKQLLKLWIFEVAKHYGSHSEKTTLTDVSVILHIFHSNGCLDQLQLAKLPELFSW